MVEPIKFQSCSAEQASLESPFFKRIKWKEILEKTPPTTYEIISDKSLMRYAHVYICGRIFVWSKPSLKYFIENYCPESHHSYFTDIYRKMD